MKINTGQGTIPLITLIGIWSVSALTSLPGLAVSPILGELSTIFPHATELDIQMLTSLPSLLIIPFVLLAGKLAEKRFYPFAAGGALAVCSERGTLFVFFQDVAANGCQRFARYRGRIDYSAFYGIDFTVFYGRVSRQAVWL